MKKIFGILSLVAILAVASSTFASTNNYDSSDVENVIGFENVTCTVATTIEVESSPLVNVAYAYVNNDCEGVASVSAVAVNTDSTTTISNQVRTATAISFNEQDGTLLSTASILEGYHVPIVIVS